MVIVQGVGGLGNQLFKYAAAKRLAYDLNTDVKIDLSIYENKNLLRIFKLDKFNVNFNTATYDEILTYKNKEAKSIFTRLLAKVNVPNNPYLKASHVYEYDFNSPIDFLKSKKLNREGQNSFYLQGWFNSPLYFDSIKEIIQEEFMLKTEYLKNKNIAKIKEVIEKNESVSIHLRFGDYLTNTNFATLNEEYFASGIDEIYKEMTNPIFIVFTDDKERAEDFLRKMDVKMMYTNVSSEHDYLDLYLMSKCKHNIIANSTFSWWGAWLNTNTDKIILAPSIWYNNIHLQRRHVNYGMIPHSWHIIENKI
jgi:hypothetical protein